MIDKSMIQSLRETAEEAALRAGEIVRREFALPHNVQKKGPRDLVTETDHEAQAAALAVIGERHPDHYILAEEDPRSKPGVDGRWHFPDGFMWTVDPLDGTVNYAAGLPFVCAAVGVVLDGEPVAGVIYDPLRDEMFSAGRGLGARLNGKELPHLTHIPLADAVIGQDWAHAPADRASLVDTSVKLSVHCRTLRCLGSAALALTYVAAGRLQMYTNLGLQPWDVAAASVLIREVGGDLHQRDGQVWRLGDRWVFAGHPELLQEVARALAAG